MHNFLILCKPLGIIKQTSILFVSEQGPKNVLLILTVLIEQINKNYTNKHTVSNSWWSCLHSFFDIISTFRSPGFQSFS